MNVEYAICIACNLIAFLGSVTRRLDLSCYLIYKSPNETGDFNQNISSFQVFFEKIVNTLNMASIPTFIQMTNKGAQWLSGRVLDSRLRGRGFEPLRRLCVVVLEQDTFILA